LQEVDHHFTDLLIASHGDIHGPGHPAVFTDSDADVLVYHYYNAQGDAGWASTLFVTTMAGPLFTETSWVKRKLDEGRMRVQKRCCRLAQEVALVDLVLCSNC
jgi:hypothetical protein